MEPDPLSLQIAAGILIAAVVLFSARAAIRLWESRDYYMAIIWPLFAGTFGFGLIAGGVGILPW